MLRAISCRKEIVEEQKQLESELACDDVTVLDDSNYATGTLQILVCFAFLVSMTYHGLFTAKAILVKIIVFVHLNP